MSRTATIKAVVLGDASEFKEAMQDVESAASGAGDKVRRDLNESFDSLGEGAGNAEQKFIGLSDSITGTQDVMEGLRTGNVAQLAMGFADLAGAAEALWTSVGKTVTTWWAKVTATTADTAATTANTGATIGQRIATTAATIAAKAQAAAQWALNAAMSANPILLVVVAIAALVAAFVLAYKNVDWFRELVDKVAAWFVDTFWPILKQVGEWIGTAFVALWDAASAAVGFLWDRFKVLFSVLQDTLWPILQTVAGWIGDYFVFQFKAAVTIVSGLIDVFQWLYDKVQRYVFPVLETVASWIGTYFVTQWQAASTAIGWVVDKFQAVWDKAIEMKNGVVAKWDELVGFLSGIAGRITGAIGDLSTLLWDAGVGVISGLWDGMLAQWEQVKSWLSGIGSQIKGLKGPIEADRVLLTAEGVAIMQGLESGLRAGWAPVEQFLTAAGAGIGAALTSDLAGGRDVVRWGDVSAGDWSALMAQGWTGRAGDGMEAIYRPSGGGLSGASTQPARAGTNIAVTVQVAPGANERAVGQAIQRVLNEYARVTT